MDQWNAKPQKGRKTYWEVPEPGSSDAPSAARRTYAWIGFAISVIILASNVAAVLIQVLTRLLAPEVYASPIFLVASGTLPMYLFGFLPAYLMLRRLPRVPLRKNKVSVRMYLLLFVFCFGMMMLGQIISNNIINLLEFITGYPIGSSLDELLSDVPVFVTVIFSVILAPIMEELIFRKLLIDRLTPIGGFGAVLVSAILFGLFHGNFYQVFYAAGLGLILGWVYLYSGGNILYSTSLHMLFNLFGGVLIPMLTTRIGLDTEEGITIDAIAAHPVAFLLLFFYFLFVLASFITMWIFLAQKKREIKEPLEVYPSPVGGTGRQVGAFFSNPGMPVLLLLLAAMFVLSCL